MTEMLRVKNWREHQHYKSKAGTPVWIKLYRKILTDYKFRGLPEADRFKLIAIWLLASETEGLVPNDARYIADCIGARRVNLELLIATGFLETVYADSRIALDSICDTGLVPKEVEKKREDLGLSPLRGGQGEGQDRASAEVKDDIVASLDAARQAREAS